MADLPVRRALGVRISSIGLLASLVLAFSALPADAADTTPPSPDTTPPSTPSNVKVYAVDDVQIDLSWNASTDDTGVTGYSIYLNGQVWATLAGTTRFYPVYPLSSGVSYTLTVDAFDAAGNHSTQSSPHSATTASSPTPRSLGPCGTLPKETHPTTYDHVIVIWFENKSYSDLIGSSSAPYFNQLAQQCGNAQNYYGITHKSYANYMAATGGQDNGSGSVVSIFGKGVTWREYIADMPTNCRTSSTLLYDRTHNAAANYATISTSDCQSNDLPAGDAQTGRLAADLAGDALPQYTTIIPSNCTNAHGKCLPLPSVPRAEAWLQFWMDKITAMTSYVQGRTVVFVTFDEGTPFSQVGEQCLITLSNDCHVPMLVVSPYIDPQTDTHVTQLLSHYSLLKAAEQMLGIPPPYLGHANDATTVSMRDAFGI